LAGRFNYVWNSPGREFFNPIEMSFQAPFVDAATSVDPVNRENTFISYYSYGSVLGLALDLSLRQDNLNLDDYMKMVWQQYGQKEIPYTIENLHAVLNQYAGKAFGNNFFSSYIYKSGMPEYQDLFQSVGVRLLPDKDKPYFGFSVSSNEDGKGMRIRSNPKIGSPAYNAKLSKEDIILNIKNILFSEGQKSADYLKQFSVGDSLEVNFSRFGNTKTITLIPVSNPSYSMRLMEDVEQVPSKEMLQKRKEWLKSE